MSSTDGNRVLLLGGGGREHALAWKLTTSPAVGRIVAAPGNPGIDALADLRKIDPSDADAVLALCEEVQPDLVVIGPEDPIAQGISDRLREAGYSVFAPSRAAARLEWDKAWAKEFMQRHDIPTAAHRSFSQDEREKAREYVQGHGLPMVIKASGLAAGKGVVIAENRRAAVEAVDMMLSGERFGEAGETIVVEEYLDGEEASIFAITDGTDYVLLAPSQDHKRIGEGDTGPNTGGMGAYAPAAIVTPDALERIEREILRPTLRGMREEGNPFVGCLFIGLMVRHDGSSRVVEYNCRFGDPETQVILPLFRGDLYQVFKMAADGRLSECDGDVASHGVAACVVMASDGYPGAYKKGVAISGADQINTPEDVIVFHAGTARESGKLVTSGGRVLGVTAYSTADQPLSEVLAKAYQVVESIDFLGATYRRDIGRRGLHR